MRWSRRSLLVGSAAAAIVGAGRGTLRQLAEAAWPTERYGALGPPNNLGVRVPAGFEVSLVGRSGQLVPGTSYRWHAAPDGGGCLPAGGDGHVYVSNSEVADGAGGVGAVWFDGAGNVLDAGSLLTGTTRNCAGGTTPWGTWLSCEESGPHGQVWECDPRTRSAEVRTAMGAFNHEAVALDARRQCCYLTEDEPDGRLYRFLPDRWPRLDSGRLQAARVVDAVVTWIDVAQDRPDRSPLTTPFDGGEGIVVDDRSLLFATKGDRRVWELDLTTQRISVFFDAVRRPDVALTHVDNLVLHPWNGHLFVAEDGGDMELCMLTRSGGSPDGAAVVRFEGHDGSEVTGPAFSPDGRHLYVSSQRGSDGRGITIRVTGPWADWITRIDGGATVRRGATRTTP